MKKKAVMTAGIFAFALVVLVGCGGTSGTTNQTTVSHTPAPIFSSPVSLNGVNFFGVQNGWATSSNGGVFVTASGGREWKHVSPKLTPNNMATFYDFLNQNTAWLLDESKDGTITVCKTFDRGRYWTQMGTLHLAYPGGGVQVDFVDALHGLIENTLPGMMSLPAVLYSTNNGGSTWKQINSTDDSGNHSNKMPFGGEILFHTALDGWLYGSPRGFDMGGLYHTNNGGLQWHHIDIPVSKKDHHAVMLFPSTIVEFNPQVLIVPVFFQRNGVQVDQKLYSSTNDGLTWTVHNLPADSSANISFLNGAQGWVISMNGALYQTDNSGHTWKLLQPNLNLNATYPFQFATAVDGWVVVNGKLYYTRDSGEWWEKIYG
ncbi:hypothetical protein D2Q93_04420 [Alicyclobacillaceae bacterium I2511]|nr:hypothetical protein D2Q93_04420 [Alicyclobacillaceae bacterium I2511]